MRLRNQGGQTTTEYILIIILVAIAVIIALHLFGGSVKDKFMSSGKTVQKTDSDTADGNQSDSGSGSSSSSGRQSSGSSSGSSGSQSQVETRDAEIESKYFGDEEFLMEYEKEKKKAWLKTILVFAVAGAILMMLIFMTIERLRLIRKQMMMQQDMDDIRRRGAGRGPVTFKKPLKPKDD